MFFYIRLLIFNFYRDIWKFSNIGRVPIIYEGSWWSYLWIVVTDQVLLIKVLKENLFQTLVFLLMHTHCKSHLCTLIFFWLASDATIKLFTEFFANVQTKSDSMSSTSSSLLVTDNLILLMS